MNQYDGELISGLTKLVLTAELEPTIERHLVELETREKRQNLSDPLRWYVLRDVRGHEPAFTGQRPYEMLASEALNRNSELRGIHSGLRWVQDVSRGER